jgi:glycerol-1-phosphatase
MLSPLLERYDSVLIGIEGCLWVDDRPTTRAAEAVAALRSAGKRVAFLTDDARHPGEDYVRRLWQMGFRAALQEVVTVGGAIQFLLAGNERWRTAFVIGSAALHRHVEDAGLRVLNYSDLATRTDVVVVAAHPDFDYRELRAATEAILRGAVLLGADREALIDDAAGRSPGTGALLAALETATGAKARTVGKPEAHLFATALDRLGPGRALVVGHRLDSDLPGARAAGLDAALVLTGATTREQALEAMRGDRPPVAVAPTFSQLVLAGSGTPAAVPPAV